MLLFNISLLHSSKKNFQIMLICSEQVSAFCCNSPSAGQEFSLSFANFQLHCETHTNCSLRSELLMFLDYLKVCEIDE